ncbi:hypothetical protein MTO96_022372 [Rhipicephalus appendiculatus]
MSGVHKKVCPDEAFDSLEGYHALPVELRGVAEAELGETPAKRREALAAITQLLQGSWVTDEVSYLDLHRAGLFCLEHLARDPAAQVAGIALLVDYGGFTMDKLLYVSISLVRRGLQYMQLRLHGHNFENLHKEISPMALPEEYGGQRPPLDPEECWKAVDADKDYFVACSRYGYATNDEDDHPTEPEPQLEITSL